MKRRSVALLIALPLLLACDDGGDDSGFISSSPPIVGSGIMVSEYRSVAPFDSVDLQAFAGVTITAGISQSVRVEADDNIIEHIGTKVLGGVLMIDSDSTYDTPRGVKVFLNMGAARSLILTGVGSIAATNINSGGTIRATLSGVGSITLSGVADALAGTLSGGGSIDAQGLLTRSSTIILSGQGDCRVTATAELDATISGVGDIYYAGDPPQVRSSISGYGRLIPM